jgi:hypothetical protein
MAFLADLHSNSLSIQVSAYMRSSGVDTSLANDTVMIHVGVSVLPWQKYVSGLLQQYSVGSDDAFVMMLRSASLMSKSRLC